MASLNVTFPETGTVLRRGNTYIINWDPIGSQDDDVKITLYENTTSGGASVLEIVTSTDPVENSGVYIWEIPASLELRSDYTIRVKPIADAFYGESGIFQVAEKYSLSDFSNTEDLERYALLEIEAGISFEGVTWTLITGPYYRTSSWGLGDLARVEWNGADLKRVYSKTYCKDNAGTYFHNYANGQLYINIGEDPDGSGNTIIGYTWIGITNRQDADYLIDFIPEGSIAPIYYLPYLDKSGLPEITQKVGEYYTSAMTSQFGSVGLINDGDLWEMKTQYLWHNKKVRVKIGEKNYLYDQYVTVFTGVTRKPSWSDKRVTINLKDTRIKDLIQVPADRFDTTTYPNLESDAENKVIPILFGEKTGIVCYCVNSSSYIYKISQTSFNGNSYPLSQVDAVYQAGVRIYETTNYTVDLTNGQITLLEDPGDDEITVDAEGIKCQYDFDGSGSGNDPGDPTGVYSDNVADILFFILTELNGIPVSRIDLDSFDALQTKRTQKIGFYLSSPVNTINIIRTLQASTLFHFIPKLDGGYMVRYYDRAITSDSKYFISGEYGKGSFQLEEDTESAYKIVVIKYDKAPGKDIWKELSSSTDEVGYKYGEDSTLTVETFLTNSTEAGTLLTFYQTLVDEPGNKVKAQVSADAMDSIPTDKSYFSRQITKGDGTDFTILDEEVYLLLEVRKSLSNGRVSLVGLLDTQAGGTGSHADEAHVDWTVSEEHTDHSDTAHSDVTAHDDYDDVAYGDRAYEDNNIDSYNDSYIDHTDDVWHQDKTYDIYTDYTDEVTHLDDDPAHSDSYSDIAHSDGHADYNDYTHTDEHGDEAYVDSEV